MDETEAAALEKIPWKERDARIGLMLRALLEERFKLKVREETKVVPVYALVLAKGGPKAGLRTAVPSLTSGPRMMMDMSGWKVTKINMDELAAQISLQQGVERIVVNETGLKGDYSFDLFLVAGRRRRTNDSNVGRGAAGAEAGAAKSAGESICDRDGGTAFGELDPRIGVVLQRHG